MAKQLVVDGIGKIYAKAPGNAVQTRGSLVEKLKSIGRPGSVEDGKFWALRDVSFHLDRGKVLGVIGANGSGKSTLLKILARITPPTEGRAWIGGRVGALLEVGTGFHPDLSGRDNILLNGAMMGMTPQEVRLREEEIIEFAEIANFIDTAVKHYSSGMFMRLAFSVAAHLDSEIMIVDEVLAVGDSGYQQKCKAKLASIATDGRTVLFTSHDMAAVNQLCHSCVLLKSGQVAYFGDTKVATDTYAAIAATPAIVGEG